MEAKAIIGGIIALVLGLYVLAAILPGAISTMTAINGSSTSGYGYWGSSVLSLWGIIPLLAMIAAVYLIIRHFVE